MSQGPPESAVARAMECAVQKYGAGLDRTTWTFRAEPVPKITGADVVRFRYEGGAFVRIG